MAKVSCIFALQKMPKKGEGKATKDSKTKGAGGDKKTTKDKKPKTSSQ